MNNFSTYIETCPECGADLEHYSLCTNPPIRVWRCHTCGWRYENREKVMRVPFKISEEVKE